MFSRVLEAPFLYLGKDFMSPFITMLRRTSKLQGK